MSDVRGTFMECLKAVQGEFQQGKVQVQGNARVVNLGPDVVPGQVDETRITAGGILGLVEGMMAKNKEETSVQGLEEYQLKIMDLEGRLEQLQTDLNQEKQLRLGLEEKLIDMKEELNNEKHAGVIKDKKLKKLEEDLQKEKDQKLIQAELLIEKQKKVMKEKESKINVQDELSKKEIELNEAKYLVTKLEQTIVKNETKFNVEKIAIEKLLKKCEEELIKEKELRTENKKVKELEEELKKERDQRMKNQMELENERAARFKLEQRCEEMAAALQKAMPKKPQLTAAEQKKYGVQLLAACGCNYHADVDKVRRLLSLGVHCDERDSKNWTTLHHAAFEGRADICQLLLDAAPALVNERDKDNWTPLHLAARDGHLSVVRLLVQHNADRGLRNSRGRTALDEALARNNTQVADYLTKLQ